MIENRFVTTESSFVNLAAWDACVDPGANPVLTDKALPVWVGIDASAKHDATAVVAVTFEAQRIRLVWHRIFQPTPAEPLDFAATIEGTVLDLNERFLIRKVLFDPWQMLAVSQRLTKQGIVIEEFPQSPGNLTIASQNLYELIEGRNLVLYPSAEIRLAVSRAVAIETSRGRRITKEKASHKIDVVVALAMAAHAAVQGQSEPGYGLDPFQPDFVDRDDLNINNPNNRSAADDDGRWNPNDMLGACPSRGGGGFDCSSRHQ
jgi:phage terminase large subunit-like protein